MNNEPSDHQHVGGIPSVSDATDPIDDRIVASLVRNGRASYADVGRRVGLSAHAVGERVRRLIRSGAITGFTATLDLARLGRSLDAIVDVRLLPTTMPEAFEREALKLETVRELIFVTGRFDYLLRLACRNSQDLDRTVRALRQQGGAAVTETRIVLRAHHSGILSDVTTEGPLARDF